MHKMEAEMHKYANIRTSGRGWHGGWRWFLLIAVALLSLPLVSFGQVDEGAITGTVTDPKGAVIPHASVKLTDVDTNFVLTTESNGSGNYVFEPVKIGRYSVSVGAPGFSTTTKSGLELHVGDRLNADIRLQVGSTAITVEVTADTTPLLQTEDSSAGQVMTQKEITDIPLNQRNYVFVAQLASGVVPSNGSRGQGNGDFDANGQRETENNFILDGVDNNSSAIDFLNGASYNVKPPPDALQEFKVDTADSSAQFGHSAGAVVNATIKSGTNQFHGDVWEFIRNNDFGEAKPTQWSEGVTHPTTVLPYHQNQFGATFGGPVVKNKLFFFADYEGNRIIQDNPGLMTVPTALMRSSPGNFSELLNPALTGQSGPVLGFEPNSGGGTGGTKYLGSACGNPQNVMCASEINPIALKLFQAAYPLPNTGPVGQTYNNATWIQATNDNVNQFDVRADYNLSKSDQMFLRLSYSKEGRTVSPPLGPVFDGGNTFDDGTFTNNGKNMVFSWNHVFTQTLINQARFGYDNGFFDWVGSSAFNSTVEAQYGLGGLPPYSAALQNGGLPILQLGSTGLGLQTIGPPYFEPSPERQNGYQIVDDVSKVLGNHSLKFGVVFQNIRYSALQPATGNGVYYYGGPVTSNPAYNGTSPCITGNPNACNEGGIALANFFADQMNGANLSQPAQSESGQWADGYYLQDDWKVSPRLTLNLGLRYDYTTAPIEVNDHQAEFNITGGFNVAAGGVAQYILPNSQKNVAFAPLYLTALAASNIPITYSANRSLLNPQKTNFAPRFGFAYQPVNKFVVRGAFGTYYQSRENLGDFVDKGINYPYDIEQSFPEPTCALNNCPSNGLHLATGIPAGNPGLSSPTVTGWQQNVQTGYTMSQNLTVEYAIDNNTSFTLGYVGSLARHLPIVEFGDDPVAILPQGVNNQPYEPWPSLNGNVRLITDNVIANYNSLQAKVERHFAHGLSFLSDYTWSHNLDDDREPLPDNYDSGNRNTNVFGPRIDYTNSLFDVRQRFIFTGTYDLPFGTGRTWLTEKGPANYLLGGWSSTVLFRAQDGAPFSVGSNTTTVNGAGANPYLIHSAYAAGGSPNATNPGIACAPKTRTLTHWFNPCAFADPTLGNLVTAPIYGAANILPYLGGPKAQIAAPGFERIDLTLTKNFPTFEKQYLQFRVDVFNLLNTPSWGIPGQNNTGTNGGLITSNRYFGLNTPDPRFFQLALKYYF